MHFCVCTFADAAASSVKALLVVDRRTTWGPRGPPEPLESLISQTTRHRRDDAISTHVRWNIIPALTGTMVVGRATPGRDGTAALRRLELLELQRGRRLSPYEPLAAEYICGGKDRHARLAPKLRGVNLGGWLVLEPWVTPSLFYQFEGKPPQQTAMDHYTFCSVLGPREGNRQLREHWRKWVTEGDLRALVDQGINTLRIPVGDWMWQPYSPYTGYAQASPDGVRNPSCLPVSAGAPTVPSMSSIAYSARVIGLAYAF